MPSFRLAALRRAAVLAVFFALLSAQVVWADGVAIFADGPVPITDNGTITFGNVCVGSETTKPLTVAVRRVGNGQVFANSASVAVSPSSVTGSGVTASGGGTIVLPANWVTVANNSLSTQTTTINVTITATAPGAITGTLVVSAIGAENGGGTLMRNTPLDVSATVVVCDTTAPTLNLPANITAEATGPAGALVTYVATATDSNPASPAVTCAPASGATFPVGTTPVSCSATDAAGNTGNGSFNVHVVDTTAPVISGVPQPIAAEASGPSGAMVTYTSPTALDTVDGSTPVACAPASGATFPLGTTTVTCASSDAAGNTSHAAFSVNVADTVAPILVVPSPLPVQATSPAGASVSYSPVAFDVVDGPISPVCAPPSGSTFPVGSTSVSCSATDAAGNTANGSFTVDVIDTTPPSLVVPDSFSVEATGPGGATATWVANAFDIVDGAVAPVCVPASGALFPLGPTTVTCTATDAAGNTSSGSFVVTVVDTTAPELTLPTDQLLEATSAAGAVATFAATATDAVSGDLTPVCSPASASTFPLGTTSVSCIVADAAGNGATGSFIVKVVDTTPPSLVVPGPLSVEATGPAGATATWVASAFDLVDGPVTPICTPASGAMFPLGSASVTCTATDAANNASNGGFVVTVVDTTAPGITAPAPITVEGNTLGGASVAGAGATGAAIQAFLNGATAVDLVDATPAITNNAPVLFPLGPTSVTFTATDDFSNSSSATSSVHVADTTAPALANVPTSFVRSTIDPAGAVVTYSSPTAQDVVAGPRPVTCAPASGSTFPVGMTTVTCTAGDGNGNTASASFDITVDLYQASFKAPVDGPSVLNVAKAGRVIPVKVEVFKNSVENSTGPVTIGVAKMLSCTANTTDELETYAAAGSSNTGNLFRWDGTADFWIYNLDTSASGMTAGNCYRGNVYLDGTLAGFFQLKLSK